MYLCAFLVVMAAYGTGLMLFMSQEPERYSEHPKRYTQRCVPGYCTKGFNFNDITITRGYSL